MKYSTSDRKKFRASVLSAFAILLTCGVASADYVVKDLYTITGDPNSTVFQYTAYAPYQAFGGQLVGSSSQISGQGYLWNGSGTPINMTPAGWSYAFLYATDGTYQVGKAETATTAHAMLWNGTSASAVDLNPSTLNWSIGLGVHGSQQVGYGSESPTGNNHAIVWNSTAASAVDLHPAGYTESFAGGTDGIHQVGHADNHAMVWSGTAASAVDLNTSDFGSSAAYGVSGDQVVGSAITTYDPVLSQHAILWNLSTKTYTDLTPGLKDDTYTALATNGVQQVGFELGHRNALLWSGTGQSMVNLQNFLPATYTQSIAFSIDGQGNVFGVAADVNGAYHAVEWSPTASTPEPSAAALACVIAGAAVLRRRRRAE